MYRKFLFSLPLLLSVASTAWGIGESYQNFPTPAPGSFGVVIAPLTDGALLVWNGNTVYRQGGLNLDYFQPIATGYSGDPGFIAVSPNGQNAALGAGQNGDIYLVNVANPGPATVTVNTANNFSGAWISNTQLVINRAVFLGPGPFDFDLPELVLIDFSGTPVFKVVVDDVGIFSAAITADNSLQYLYAADGLTGETHQFAISSLINAFNTDTPLAWTTGSLIGTYNSGGPGAVDASGNLIIGGFGNIQVVDPSNGNVIDTQDPVGTGFEYYFAFFNAVTNEIVAVQSIFGGSPALWGPANSVVPVPALQNVGLGLVAILIFVVGKRGLQRRQGAR